MICFWSACLIMNASLVPPKGECIFKEEDLIVHWGSGTVGAQGIIAMGSCKRDVTPELTHWS